MSWEQEFGDMIGIPYVDTSYEQQRTAETIPSTLSSQRQDVTGNQDAWGGFWKTAAATVLDYGIKRDAALVGVQLQQASRPAAPLYTAGVAAGPSGLTVSPLMLIIGGVVIYAMLQK